VSLKRTLKELTVSKDPANKPPLRLVGDGENASDMPFQSHPTYVEMQQRLDEAERRAKSFEEAHIETLALLRKEKLNNLLLIHANIEREARRMLIEQSLLIAQLDEELEASRTDYTSLDVEYQKLLQTYEVDVDTARSIIEMLNEELAKADKEAIDARYELMNLPSAMSVAQLLHDDLAQFESRLSVETFIHAPDVFIVELGRISDLLLENEHADIRKFGFQLQTFSYEFAKNLPNRGY